MTALERNSHRSILEHARTLGAYVVTQSSPPADTGTPDHLWCLRGYFVGVEIKPDGAGDLSAIQRQRAREIVGAGGIFAVLRAVADVDELARRLRDARDRNQTYPFMMYLATNNPRRPTLR